MRNVPPLVAQEEQVRQKQSHGHAPRYRYSMDNAQSADLRVDLSRASADGAYTDRTSTSEGAAAPLQRYGSLQAPTHVARFPSFAPQFSGPLVEPPDLEDMRSPLLDTSSQASGSMFGAKLERERHHYRETLEAEIRKVAAFVHTKKRELDNKTQALEKAAAAARAPPGGVRAHLALVALSLHQQPYRTAVLPRFPDTCHALWFVLHENPNATVETRSELQGAQRGGSATAVRSNALIEKDASYLYVQLCRFSNFIEMNRTGFRKVLKKHDKVTDVKLSGEMMPQVHRNLPAADVSAVHKVRPPHASCRMTRPELKPTACMSWYRLDTRRKACQA